MNLETPKVIVLILIGRFFLQDCSIFGTNSLEDVLFGQAGTLSWSGSPAVVGGGILFETKDEAYGAPETGENYNDYFPENENQVQVIEDIKLTGDTTARGWGANIRRSSFQR